MGNCLFTLKTATGEEVIKDATEAELKKYLAKGGIAKLKQSGDVDVTIDFVERDINKDLSDKIKSFDESKLSDEDKKLLDLARKINSAKMNTKNLADLNKALDAFLKTGSFDGLGSVLDRQKVADNATAETVKIIKDSALRLNWVSETFERLRTLPTKLSAIVKGDDALAVVRVFTGLADHNRAYGSKDGFAGQVDKIFFEFGNLINKTKIAESLESQVKIGAVLDITQHKEGASKKDIQKEFEGRKKAMADGIANAKKESKPGSKYYKMHNDTIVAAEEVYNKYIKDSKTPEEALAKLTKAEKQVADFMLNEFKKIYPELDRLSRLYKGKSFDKFASYFPRVYIKPIGPDPSIDAKKLYQISDDQLEAATNGIGDMFSGESDPGLKSSQSTAFDQRTIEADQVPVGGIVNYNAIDVFQDNIRRQLYDLNTMATRSYMATVLNSQEFYDALGQDRDLLNVYRRAYIQRIQNERNALYRDSNQGVLDAISQTMSNIGNRIALGGIATPFFKQYVPTMVSTFINTSNNPELLYSTFSDIAQNGAAFRMLISKSPVSRRHAQEAQFINGQISAKDISKLKNTAKRRIKNWDEKMDAAFMSSLKFGDQTSAGVAFLTYYKQSLLNQGLIKSSADFDIVAEAANPNPLAMAFAEQRTSTTLNVNENVDRAARQIGGGWIPFVSFAVNSKANFAINFRKSFLGDISGKDRIDAGRKLAANISESISVNLVGASLRYAFLAGTTKVLTSIIAAAGSEDDKEKAQLVELINKYKQKAGERIFENVQKYIVADLISGQIAGNYTDAMVDDFTMVYNKVSASIKGEPVPPEDREYSMFEGLKLLGSRGIPVVSFATGLINLSSFFEQNDLFREQKFGYIDRNGKVAVSEDEKNVEKPEWSRAVYGAVGIANLMSSFTGSFAEVSAITRRLPQMVASAEKEIYGKNKNLANRFLPNKDNPYNYSSIDNEEATIGFLGEDYYLTPAQLQDLRAYKKKWLKDEGESEYKYLYDIVKEEGIPRPDLVADKQIKSMMKSVGMEYIIDKYLDATGEEYKLNLQKKSDVKE